MRLIIVTILVTLITPTCSHRIPKVLNFTTDDSGSEESEESTDTLGNATLIDLINLVKHIIHPPRIQRPKIKPKLPRRRNISLGDVGDKPALFCQIAQLKNAYYFYGVIGDQYNYGVTSLGSCLYLCVSSNLGRRQFRGNAADDDQECKAVNYFRYHKACQLLSQGMENLATANKRMYGRMDGAAHAYIQSCYDSHGESSMPTRTTPQPVPTVAPISPRSIGCGISAYPPSISEDTQKQRIIRGQEAKPHSWPWTVLFNLNFGQQRSFCGGTLLRVKEDAEESDVVLTAAHCVTRPETQGTYPAAFDTSVMTVVAGDHRRYVQELNEVHSRVASVLFHPEFRFAPHTGAVNDLAIIKLQQPIRFNDFIRPVCLPEQGAPIPSASTCVAAGWGRNDSRQMYVMPDALQQLVVPIQDANTCKNSWGQVYSEQEMLCAGTLTGTASTCQGDSGGMLACKSSSGHWVQYGVTSFGIGGSCLEPYKPAVFARVSSYVDWILRNVQSLSTLTSPQHLVNATFGEEYKNTSVTTI